MSILLNPDGSPIEPELNEEVLKRVLKSFSFRINILTEQITQLGFLTEFLFEELSKTGITINTSSFPEWATKRYEALKAEAEKAVKENTASMEELKKTMDDATLELDIISELEDDTSGSIESMTEDPSSLNEEPNPQ